MPALDCVSLCIHARFRYLRRTNPRVGRYTPDTSPQAKWPHPNRAAPGRPQKVPPPGSYRRPPAPRLRPGRVYCGEEACPFSIRVKRLPPACSVPYWWGMLLGGSAFAVEPLGLGLQVAAAGAPAAASAEKASGSGGSAKTPAKAGAEGKCGGARVRRRLLCPNRHRSRWQGLARRVPRGG